MEDADLFIDDIDGIFDDDEDDDEGPLTDDEDNASLGDVADHDSSMAVATCSSFPMLMEGDDDGHNDEDVHHLPTLPISNLAGSAEIFVAPPGTETRLDPPSVPSIHEDVAGQDQVHHVKQQALHDLGQEISQGDGTSRISDLSGGMVGLTTATIPRPGSSTAVESAALALPLPSTASKRRSVSEPGAANAKHKTMRRSGKHLEAQVCPLPPPSWHSEAADRHHRQAMILEIARLLQARKKTVPSSEWLRQLPHKARKLEERLYRNSTSLEAYLDKATLKTRLKKLARTITRQFEEAKKQRTAGGMSSVLGWNQHGLGQARHRGSDVSAASIAASVSSMASLAASSTNSASSLRDSFSTVNSLDSLRAFRESLVRRTTTPGTSEVNEGGSSIPSNKMNGSNGYRATFMSLPTRESTGQELRPSPVDSQQHNEDDSSLARTGGLAAPTTKSPTTTPPSPVSQSTGMPSPQLSGTVQPTNGESSSVGQSTTNSVDRVSSGNFNRPSFVNAHLHQQVIDSIRNQQDEVARRSQGRQTSGSATASHISALSRSSSAGYGAGAGGPAGTTAGPGRVGPAAPSSFPMFNPVGAGMSASDATHPAGMNVHNLSDLQMNSSFLAAAMMNQRMNGARSMGAGGGLAFSSMTSAGGPSAASGMNSQHLAAAAALHPSVIASMNNRSMLQQAFLEATAQSLMPGAAYSASNNPAQHLQQQQQQQSFSPLYQGNHMVPDPSLLFGAGGGSSIGGAAPAPSFEHVFPNGLRAASAHPGNQHPPTPPPGMSQQQHPVQRLNVPGTLAQPPPAAHPTKAGPAEDSEPLSPSSFNWD